MPSVSDVPRWRGFPRHPAGGREECCISRSRHDARGRTLRLLPPSYRPLTNASAWPRCGATRSSIRRRKPPVTASPRWPRSCSMFQSRSSAPSTTTASGSSRIMASMPRRSSGTAQVYQAAPPASDRSLPRPLQAGPGAAIASRCRCAPATASISARCVSWIASPYWSTRGGRGSSNPWGPSSWFARLEPAKIVRRPVRRRFENARRRIDDLQEVDESCPIEREAAARRCGPEFQGTEIRAERRRRAEDDERKVRRLIIAFPTSNVLRSGTGLVGSPA